jgi:hypothetical protein
VTQGFIGNDEHQTLKNMFKGSAITISPATKSRCISDSVAVILTIRNMTNLNLIYPEAKKLSN